MKQQIKLFWWHFKRLARKTPLLKKIFKTTNVFTGARISFSINGVPVAYASGFNYTINHQLQPIEVLDKFDLVENDFLREVVLDYTLPDKILNLTINHFYLDEEE